MLEVGPTTRFLRGSEAMDFAFGLPPSAPGRSPFGGFCFGSRSGILPAKRVLEVVSGGKWVTTLRLSTTHMLRSRTSSTIQISPPFIAARQLNRLLDEEIGLQGNFQGRLEEPSRSFEGEDADAVKRRHAATKKMNQASGKFVERKTGKKDPKYKTPVFKCHGDYEECIKASLNPKRCLALFAVCVGQHLIPFVRHAE